jgi:hypothetical protein
MNMDMDDTSTNGSQPPRSKRGRPFSKGNPGRTPGAKNKTTLVAEALLRGEETELVRKAIELAKAGDTPMLKFLLDRLLPKEMLTPSEGAAAGALVREFTRALDVAELSQRIVALEVKLTGGPK